MVAECLKINVYVAEVRVYDLYVQVAVHRVKLRIK